MRHNCVFSNSNWFCANVFFPTQWEQGLPGPAGVPGIDGIDVSP